MLVTPAVLSWAVFPGGYLEMGKWHMGSSYIKVHMYFKFCHLPTIKYFKVPSVCHRMNCMIISICPEVFSFSSLMYYFEMKID